jgi:hypothetical protein
MSGSYDGYCGIGAAEQKADRGGKLDRYVSSSVAEFVWPHPPPAYPSEGGESWGGQRDRYAFYGSQMVSGRGIVGTCWSALVGTATSGTREATGMGIRQWWAVPTLRGGMRDRYVFSSVARSFGRTLPRPLPRREGRLGADSGTGTLSMDHRWFLGVGSSTRVGSHWLGQQRVAHRRGRCGTVFAPGDPRPGESRSHTPTVHQGDSVARRM